MFFWKNLSGGDQESAAADESRARFVARAYTVFNAEQVDGYQALVIPALSDSERIESAERFFAAIPANVIDGQAACYNKLSDTVEMVPYRQFRTATGYYSVLAHELTHWSGIEKRLGRDMSGRFGSEAYAMEELVAELSAAFVGGILGLPSEPRTGHAPYIASWLKVLKNDPCAIFTAASKAQAAADYLLSFVGTDPSSDQGMGHAEAVQS